MTTHGSVILNRYLIKGDLSNIRGNESAEVFAIKHLDAPSDIFTDSGRDVIIMPSYLSHKKTSIDAGGDSDVILNAIPRSGSGVLSINGNDGTDIAWLGQYDQYQPVQSINNLTIAFNPGTATFSFRNQGSTTKITNVEYFAFSENGQNFAISADDLAQWLAKRNSPDARGLSHAATVIEDGPSVYTIASFHIWREDLIGRHYRGDQVGTHCYLHNDVLRQIRQEQIDSQRAGVSSGTGSPTLDESIRDFRMLSQEQQQVIADKCYPEYVVESEPQEIANGLRSAVATAFSHVKSR